MALLHQISGVDLGWGVGAVVGVEGTQEEISRRSRRESIILLVMVDLDKNIPFLSTERKGIFCDEKKLSFYASKREA